MPWGQAAWKEKVCTKIVWLGLDWCNCWWLGPCYYVWLLESLSVYLLFSVFVCNSTYFSVNVENAGTVCVSLHNVHFPRHLCNWAFVTYVLVYLCVFVCIVD